MLAVVMYWYCLFYWNASDCLIIDMIVHMVALGPALLLREIQLNRGIYQNIKLLIHPVNLFSLA